MRLLAPGVALVAVAVASAARADDPAYRACIGKAGSMDAALVRCGDELLKRANASLEDAWRAALADMPGDAARRALSEEQAVWAAFRDKSCLAFSTGDFARDVQAVSFPVCRAGVIDARAKYLRSLTDN